MASSGCVETIYSVSFPNIPYDGKLSIIKVLADGSCFFHSVLRSFNMEYITTKTNIDRRRLAKLLRVSISKRLEEIDTKTGENVYSSLGGGYYKEYNKAVSGALGDKYSLSSLQKELNSDKAVDHSYIQTLSDHFDMNIYIIHDKTLDLYCLGTNKSLLYKDRKSIAIHYSEGHYDIIGIKRISDKNIRGVCKKNDIIFDCLFSRMHPFSIALKTRLDELVD